MKFFWETRHLWLLLLLITLGGAGFWAIRNQLIPDTYGDLSGRYGPYRAAALDQLKAKPSVLITDSVCHECHQEVQEERAEAKHMTVRCIHCHGSAQKHVAEARAAEESPEKEITPAQEWDGDFLTKIDLYTTKDKATCLVCHETVLGMPKDFQQLNVADHLEEQEAEEPTSRETCFECHGGHDTAP